MLGNLPLTGELMGAWHKLIKFVENAGVKLFEVYNITCYTLYRKGDKIMSVKILASTDVRDHMSQVINEIARDGNSCFITQYGKAEAVLLSIDRFDELMSLVEDALDEKDELLALRVEQARRSYAKGKGVPFAV